jgi:hypothetical protein
MNYGYARVSTREQDLTGQVAELLATGCAEIFKEKASGARGDRAELAKVVKRLEPGDVLVVTRLDRLARSTRDLLNVLASVTERGAGFRSLKDTWCDTTTPHGRLMLTVLGGLAEFERELIRARTGEGRERAKVKSAVRATAQAFPSSAPRSAGAPECRRFGSRCCQHLRSRPGDHLPAASGCRQAGVAAPKPAERSAGLPPATVVEARHLAMRMHPCFGPHHSVSALQNAGDGSSESATIRQRLGASGVPPIASEICALHAGSEPVITLLPSTRAN